MSNSVNHKIFAETECISEQTMFDYIDKKLSAKECHIVEKHLLHCEFCTDALEGLEMVKDRNRINVINQKIKELTIPAIEEKKVVGFNRFNYKAVLAVAASVLLLIGGIFFFNILNQKNEMAIYHSEQTASTPPPPPPAADDAKTSESTESSFAKEIPEEEKAANKPQTNQVIDNQPKQEQLTLTDKENEAYYKKNWDGDKAAAGSSIVSRNAIAQGEANEKDIMGELSEPESVVSDEKEDLGEKDSDDQETRKQGVATGRGAPPATTSLSEKQPEKRPEDIMEREESVDNLAKKYTKYDGGEFSRSKSKKRDATAKEEKSAAIAYAPQNIAAGADDVPLETISATSTLEQEPEYPGGQDSLLGFIHNHFNASLLEKNQELTKETVQVQLTVDKKGDVKNIKIVKGINGEMDKELLRVLSLMPKWKPGSINGEAVSKQISIPIQLHR